LRAKNKELRDLQGHIEKLKIDNDKLKEKLSQQKEGFPFENDLLQSHLSCSLGLSKQGNQNLMPIDSLILNQTPMRKKHETSMSQNFSESKHRNQNEIMITENSQKLSHRTPFQQQEEGMNQYLSFEKEQYEQTIKHLAAEIQSLVFKNNEIAQQYIDLKEEHIEKLNTIHTTFAQEREQILEEK
jgi:predicted RNase H-like nuclease (RuvC/YqgF family)